MLSLRLLIQRGMRITPLGIFLRIMVNDKPLNLEKTTSSVLSVFLLIYDFFQDQHLLLLCSAPRVQVNW